MQDQQISHLITVCEHARIYVQSDSYDALCAYISGFHDASNALIGFREWLLSEGTKWTNLPWWALIREQEYSGSDISSPLTPAESRHLTTVLAERLRKFLDCITSSGGLQSVYQKYFLWTLAQNDKVTQMTREAFQNGCYRHALGDTNPGDAD